MQDRSYPRSCKLLQRSCSSVTAFEVGRRKGEASQKTCQVLSYQFDLRRKGHKLIAMIVETRTKQCPKCQSEFACSTQDCWCAEYPPILAPSTDKQCLCRACLTNEIKSEIDFYLATLDEEKITKVQQMGRPQRLIQGIDYEINDRGLWVFSKWYLLRKGACCGSGCQNCPY